MMNSHTGYLTLDVFSYLQAYLKNNEGRLPTYREITEECGLSSKSVAYYHVTQLRNAGLLQQDGTGRYSVKGQFYALNAN